MYLIRVFAIIWSGVLIASGSAAAQTAESGPSATADPAEAAEARLVKEAATEQARERELEADEDPSAQREAEIQQRTTRWFEEPNQLRIYGSGRVRLRSADGDTSWGDGGSRMGAELRYQALPRQWLVGRYESGFNLLEQVNGLLEPGEGGGEGGDDSVFKRLSYVGIETTLLVATFGKNWSTYYKVAGFTDRFEGTGGSASGTFNAGTDGGGTGTGRADNVLQSRLYVDFLPSDWGVKPFNLNVQLQSGQGIPHTDYEYRRSAGVSAIIETKDDFTVGFALNWADVRDSQLGALEKQGIDDDAVALLAGTRWYGERWYAGLTVSRLANHESTDEKIYFDGTGTEFYGQYQVKGPWWLVGGINYLRPDGSEEQAGRYRVNYGVVGARYSVDGFGKMLYANARIDNGRLADGTALGNTYTIGVRWDLDHAFRWQSPWR